MSDLSDRLLSEIDAAVHPGCRTPAYLAELERAGIPAGTPAEASTIISEGVGGDRRMRALTLGEVTAVVLRALDSYAYEFPHDAQILHFQLGALADEIDPPRPGVPS